MLPSQDGACRCPPPPISLLAGPSGPDRRGSGTGWHPVWRGDFIGIVSGRVSSVADLSRGGALWTWLLRVVDDDTGSLPGRQGGGMGGGKRGLSIRWLWAGRVLQRDSV